MRNALGSILIFSATAISFSVFAADQPVARTEIDRLIAADFQGFVAPDSNAIKKQGLKRSYPYLGFEDVWNGIVLVLMQRYPIIHSSGDAGIIVVASGPPLAVFVEKSDPVTVHVKWLEDLYRSVNNPAIFIRKWSPDAQLRGAEIFFDKLATQVYAGQKWQYLYKTTSK